MSGAAWHDGAETGVATAGDGQPAAAGAPDRVYAGERRDIADFRFGSDVAAVFDDMLERSVPFYGEIQRMILEMGRDFALPGTNVVDFGCSTGTTLAALGDVLPEGVRLVGIDNSPDMLERAQRRLAPLARCRPVELRVADLNDGVAIENASLALLVLTLQFIRPLRRARLMADVYAGMVEQGALILVEKVLGDDSLFNRLFIRYYYDLKRRRGYSDLEIAQKREALENVLVPYKLPENRELLLQTGFRHVEVFFKWYNFCGLVAIK
jgi:tRNA (cmo5U34)-methyltransferase